MYEIKHDSKPKMERVIMDSMLLILLLGLLALPILTIGMTGYKNTSEVLGTEAVVEDPEPVDDSEEAVVEIRSFQMRVGSAPDESDESTESAPTVRGYQAVPRMTEDF